MTEMKYQMCDYLILIEKGRVIAQGRTDDVFKNPGTVAAAKLTGCKNISRIERISDHRVKALDWGGIELVTEKKVDESDSFIGIRAHDFKIGESGENCISCGKVSVTRLPFEWYIMLENGLWWKKERSLYDTEETTDIPEKLYIGPDKIIILS